ncbi:phospholipase D gamma 1 [Citrus sinensis]|nr:phospholipase D gamma 1 [Citrus sinensis]
MSFGGSNHGQGQVAVPFETHQGSLKVLLLHGNLDVWVKEAKNLPNMDIHLSDKITSDPYVTVSICGAVIGRTFVISNSESPVWMQHFNVPVAHSAAEVHFVVKDNDFVGSQIMGAVGIPVEKLCSGDKIEGAFPILNSSRKPCKAGAVLSLSIQYTPVENMSLYYRGVGSGPDYIGVPGTYFPLRRGGKVTLYQDAHAHDGCLADLKLDGGVQFNHESCWQDVYDAINQARRLIYITGWSVYHTVRLVRDGSNTLMLGDLLKIKSQEGVRVLILAWDDPTSRSILGYKTDGIMSTNDEETRRFFKHSSVQVLLCPRSAGKGHSFVKKQEVGTIYTHHQKTVVVDADAGQFKRKIIAFVGGLDLCKGRYDTPAHPLFKTLETVHKDDYYNPSLLPIAGGPREPWHDLHCRIDGPAAYDILTNFEERWLKASKPHGLQKLKSSNDDSLLKLERIPEIVGMTEASYLSEKDPEAWHAQNLVCGKNILIDMSIHTAYVKAIRAAQHFIYIENQYFLGSSFNWDSHRDLGESICANNLIPMEIALKIANKIRANERFAAYILIPMWPEGVTTSPQIQRILYWQHKTMQMMYETIYKALVESGLQNKYVPQDYLNFFCLGNREALDGVDSSNAKDSTAANTPQVPPFPVKSCFHLIFDDEYVIIGSANINQRSLEGTRDTEIAMGAYQPRHTWASKLSNPYGQVYGYRMSLWAEHIGAIEECFNRPESLGCVRRVRSLSEQNWKQYAADEVTQLKGHLLKYPVDVDPTGKVNALPGCAQFPDVGGNILGSFIAIQENLTI